MKIIKTKEISPKEFSSIDNELQTVFSDREKLHDNNLPTFYVYIQDYAWEAFLNHGNNIYKSIKTEAQGIFLGNYYTDRFGEFVVATKYAEGNGNSTHIYVEMSEECLAEISEKCQKEQLLMLIWVHTHPGLSAFYSGIDVNCLKTNFYKEYQIGMVVDILKQQVLAFKTIKSSVNEFFDYKIFNEKTKMLSNPYGVINQRSVKSIEIVSNKQSSEDQPKTLSKIIKKTDFTKNNSNEERNSNLKDNLLETLEICKDVRKKIQFIFEKGYSLQILSEDIDKLQKAAEYFKTKLNDDSASNKKFLEYISSEQLSIKYLLQIIIGLLCVTLFFIGIFLFKTI